MTTREAIIALSKLPPEAEVQSTIKVVLRESEQQRMAKYGMLLTGIPLLAVWEIHCDGSILHTLENPLDNIT